jgi:hypothetical protein
MNTQPPLQPQLMHADQRVTGTACLICRQGFRLDEIVYACPFCQGFHHTTCWEAQRQCPALQPSGYSTWADSNPAPNARASSSAVAYPQSISYASGVGPGLPPGDRYCPRCAQIIKSDVLFCQFCGERLDPNFIQPGNFAVAPKVPNLHWGAVLALGIVTCGVFTPIWGIVQSVWAKKVEPSSNAILFYSLYFVAAILGGVLGAIDDIAAIGSVLSLGSAVLFICGSFSIKHTIESQFNRSLSGVMTFFFGPIYHQYHFNEIAKNNFGPPSILNG